MLMRGISGKRALFGLLVIFFLTVNVGGVFAADMTSNDSSCPFMGAPALCAMGPLQHLSEWQQAFAAVAQQMATAALLLLLMFIAALFWTRVPAALPLRISIPGRAPPSTSQSKKITRWLSLFELSPSQA